jgi:hypothetical protein
VNDAQPLFPDFSLILCGYLVCRHTALADHRAEHRARYGRRAVCVVAFGAITKRMEPYPHAKETGRGNITKIAKYYLPI